MEEAWRGRGTSGVSAELGIVLEGGERGGGQRSPPASAQTGRFSTGGTGSCIEERTYKSSTRMTTQQHQLVAIMPALIAPPATPNHSHTHTHTHTYTHTQ